MKSITEQYRSLQEGNMSQAQFLRNVRLALPQYVTNTTSLSDAVRILKNKSLLFETKLDESCGCDNSNTAEVYNGMMLEKGDHPDKNQVELLRLVLKNVKSDPNYYTNFKLSGVKGYKPEIMGNMKPGADQMEFVSKKLDNLIDKDNQMKVQVPREKASANKANKDSSSAVSVSIQSTSSVTLRGVPKMTAQGEKEKTINESTEKKVKVGDKIRLTKDVEGLGIKGASFVVQDKHLSKLKSNDGLYIITYSKPA